MLKHLGTQTLNTPRLLLRRFSPADAPAMYQNWAGDERVARHMLWSPFPNQEAVRAELAAWEQSYQNDDFYRWAMVEKAGGALIGAIGLTDFGSEKCPRWEPAYNIGYAYWGRGYAAEALCAVADYFWDTGASALYAAHALDNPASGRVLEKAGFVYRYKDAYQKPDGTLVPARCYRLKRPVPRHVGTRPIHTQRLLLRRFVVEDARPMYNGWAADEQVARFMRWSPHQSLAETEAVIGGWLQDYESPHTYNWAIVHRASGALIGSIGMLPFDEGPGCEGFWQPGYCLARPYWGQGCATEALLAVVEYFVRCTGITSLFCCHATGNPASGRVMEKAGFVYHHSGHYTNFAGTEVFPAQFYRYRPPTTD